MPVPVMDPPFRRSLLREEAYRRLREAILDGTLEPGERLKDADLAGWLGLSKTPLREALARLQEDGLVESAPQRYTRVTPLDKRDAHDAFPVVATLHALATTLGVSRLSNSDLEAMRARNRELAVALQEGDMNAAMAADDAFHGVLVAASANREIPRTLGRLMPRLRRLERARFGSLVGRRSVDQHEGIIGLCVRRDAQGAAEASRENWISLGTLIERSF